MASHEDNELLVRTDRGRPMGEVFRRFWLPALLTSELAEADGEPVRFRLLGEELVAFRDSLGQVGVVDAYCPHRGAPLVYGRNEECGLRCLYHGWKFDVSGTCVDLPNIPRGDRAKEKIRITAYPTFEKAGMVWTYMGPADRIPPRPAFPCFNVPEENVYIDKYQIDCNYLQVLDGELDVSHAAFVHSSLGGSNKAERINRSSLSSTGMLPYSVKNEQRPWGVSGVFVLPGAETDILNLWDFIVPAFTTQGLTTPPSQANNMRVPVDDEHTWWFRLRWTAAPEGFTEAELNEFRYGDYIYAEHEEGGWHPAAKKSNGYFQDRRLQQTGNYSGVANFFIQDFMLQEDQWGAVADRTKEHLVASDGDLLAARRRLLQLARAMQEGKEPSEPFELATHSRQLGRLDLPHGTPVDDDVISQLEALASPELRPVTP